MEMIVVKQEIIGFSVMMLARLALMEVYKPVLQVLALL